MRKVFGLFIVVLLLVVVGPAWGKETFVVHQSYQAPKGKIFSGAISADGKYIVAIDKNNNIRVWQYKTGRAIKSIKTAGHEPIVAVFHPNKPLLFTGGKDKKIVIWDVSKGLRVQSLQGHEGTVETLAVSKDGEMLISGGKDKSIIIWRLDRYKIAKKIIEPSRRVTSLDYHPDNRHVAWVAGTEVKVWDTEAGLLTTSHKLHKQRVNMVRFLPIGSHIASAGFDNQVIIWDFMSKSISKRLPVHKKSVSAISFDPLGKDMLTCSLDGSMKVWNLRTDLVTDDLNLVDKPVQDCAFANDAKTVIAVFEKSYLRGWNLGETGYLSTMKSHTKPIQAIDVSKNGSIFISASIDNQIHSWKAESKIAKQSFEVPAGHKVECIRLSPDDKHFATCGNNSDIRVWSRMTGKIMYSLNGHKGKVTSLDYHPKEPLMVSVGADKQVILWDLNSKKPIFQKEVHQGQINMVRFSNSGEYFATASSDKTALLYRTFDQQLMLTLNQAQRGVRAVAFSPTGDLLATASDDRVIRIYDTGSGQMRSELKGHEFIITDIAFSPNGRALVSISKDKTIKIWDTQTGKFVRTLSGQEDQITSMAVTADGKLIAAGNQLGLINVLRLPIALFGSKAKMLEANEDVSTDVQPVTASQETLAEPEEGEEIKTERAREFSAADVLEEQDKANDNVFDPPPVISDSELVAQKQMLNTLLLEKNTCKNHEYLETTAFSVLRKKADDQVAFYALVQVYSVRQDLQMVFLMAKLGEKSVYYPDVYTFSTADNIAGFFRVWIDEVFNLSVASTGEVKLEFVDCKNDIQLMTMPQDLLKFEVPKETTTALLSGQVNIDFRVFAGLGKMPDSFRIRLYNLIELVDKGVADINAQSLASEGIPDDQQTYGYFRLVSRLLDQFNVKTDRVLFELKRNEGVWHSYATDTDKTKSLMLPTGNYYLRVDNKVKSAFTIKKGEKVETDLE